MLSQYTQEELQQELWRREEIKEFNKWNKIPESTLNYTQKGITSFNYIVFVDDGSEGFQFLISSQKRIEKESEIINIVQNELLKDSNFDIDGWNIKNIEIVSNSPTFIHLVID